LNVFGLDKAQIKGALRGLQELVKGPGLAASLHIGPREFPIHEVVLIVRGSQGDRQGTEAALNELERAARDHIGKHIFSVDETTFSEAVVQALMAAKATVALAESCTGGLAGDLLTQAPGSSEVFELGVVAYANRFKEQVLEVPRQVLEDHGAVSIPCVEAMARGIRRLSGADFGVSISGVAGPGGGTREKPVGTVFFALAAEGYLRHVVQQFSGDRQQVKLAAAHTALALVLRHLTGDLSE